ncbi:hypothetical protein GCM10028808_30300 [Spirosoma migulaei]
MEFTVLTKDQLDAILTDRDEWKKVALRALDLTEEVKRENFAIKAGLIHYDRNEVATMLHCSTKQVIRYEEVQELKPTRIHGKVLYSANDLMAFIEKFQVKNAVLPDRSSYPKRKHHRIE